MFGWLKKDPIKKLEAEYAAKLLAARDTQRNGDVIRASDLYAEADVILAKIKALEAEAASK